MEESINSHRPDSQMGTLWREYQIGADVSAGYDFNQNQIRIAAFIAPARWVDRAGFTKKLAHFFTILVIRALPASASQIILPWPREI